MNRDTLIGLAGPDHSAGRIGTSPLLPGLIATAPASLDDTIDVVVEALDGGRTRLGPCSWTPRTYRWPIAGSPCLVAIDEHGDAHVASWWGDYTDHTPSTSLPTVTSLPGSPVDGQEIYYVADATNGVIWHLKYRAASASAYKWEYVGGPRLFAQSLVTANNSSMAQNTWSDIGAAVAVTVPLAGDYEVTSISGVDNATSAILPVKWYMGVKVGATEPTLDNTTTNLHQQSAADRWQQLALQEVKRGVAASTVLTLRFYQQGTNPSSCWRSGTALSVSPVRVG